MDFQKKVKEILGDYDKFLSKIFANLEMAGFEVDEFKELDHIAYRTENLEGYERIKKEIIELSKAYDDSIFGGRPILVCFLIEPLIWGDFKISGIEVLAPKENNKFIEGLEHAEFVTSSPLAEFMNKHNEIDFKLDAYDREVNPEIIIKFEDCAVKFHEQSLLEVRKLR